MAHAQPVTGPYVFVNGGAGILNPVNYKFEGTGDTGRYQYKLGFATTGGIGYGFGDGLRVELDGDYVHNTAHKIDTSSGLQVITHGADKDYGGFVNALYDVSAGLPVYPFFGAGVGFQTIAYDPSIDSYNVPTGLTAQVWNNKVSFAYDVIAGLSYPVPQVPGLSLTAEYRFMQLVESRSHRLSNSGGNIIIGQESTHSFLLGVRYQIFNPPPPAPSPTPAATPVVVSPAPPVARTYLVFFDWDEYSLTPRALTTVAQAATGSKSAQVTKIEVSGYTDTSGTFKYNTGLSWKRAKAVAEQLVADGVAPSDIETHGYGETHLLIPTGPGVREPQNRRVEIVLQ
jgi:outer membrane protein OmpA-like peptidoglycan-associated protein